MFLRPYKTIVFNHLGNLLAEISDQHPGKVALDAASAGMKNIKLFRRLKYVGIDIDKQAIEVGLQQHPDAIGIYADLTQISIAPNTSIATVSTHTMEAIRDKSSRNKFLSEMISATSQDGTMILLVYLKDSVELTESFSLIENSFSSIKRNYYRLPITRWFEDKILINLKKTIEGHVIAKLASFIILAPICYMLIILEKIFSKFNLGQSVVLLVCSGKKTGQKYHTGFDVTECSKVSSNYWVMSGF